jgi:hypothetical protein
MKKSFFNKVELLVEAQSDDTNIKFNVENQLHDIESAELIVRRLDGTIVKYKAVSTEADQWEAYDENGEEIIESVTEREASKLGLIRA